MTVSADIDQLTEKWIADPTRIPTNLVGWGALSAAKRLSSYPNRQDWADRAVVRRAAQDVLELERWLGA